MHAGILHPPGRHPHPGQTSPAQCMLGYTPPCPVHTKIHYPVLAGIDMATAAEGTHPTGIPPATKLGKGNIFSSMCQEFCSQGGDTWAGTPPRQLHPRVGTPRQVHPRQVHPLGRYTPPSSACWETRAKAGGTHPTGMHSCYEIIS